MQVGSIVECIQNEGYIHHIKPDLNKTYVVRDLKEKGTLLAQAGIIRIWLDEDAIYLEEIVNDHICVYGAYFEPPYMAKDFRELLPPMEINLEAILEDELVSA